MSEQERKRVERFKSPDASRRWAAGRAGLRRILGEAVRTDPRELVLTRGPHGKPALQGSSLHFNKSDSGEVAGVAVCEGREVGLDIERHRHVTRNDRIARRFFSAQEREGLAHMPEEERSRAFFDCWTVKEAVLKCDGGGLGAIPMSSYSAPLDPDWSGPVSDRWWVSRVQLGAGLSAAVALEGTEPADLELTSPRVGGGAPA